MPIYLRFLCMKCGHTAPLDKFVPSCPNTPVCPNCKTTHLRALRDDDTVGETAIPPLPSCPHCNSCTLSHRQITTADDQPKQCVVICNLCGVQGPTDSSYEGARVLWSEWCERLAAKNRELDALRLMAENRNELIRDLEQVEHKLDSVCNQRDKAERERAGLQSEVNALRKELDDNGKFVGELLSERDALRQLIKNREERIRNMEKTAQRDLSRGVIGYPLRKGFAETLQAINTPGTPEYEHVNRAEPGSVTTVKPTTSGAPIMQPITEDHVRSIFHIAGIPVLHIWQLAHSYFFFDPSEDEKTTLENARYRATRPSWLVKTPYGLIELNLRKRVVEINWKDTGYEALDVGDEYPVTKDDVTKTKELVHAYSLIKATEYLETLQQLLLKGPPHSTITTEVSPCQ